MESVIVPSVNPLTLDSIFETPCRNDPCHCTSGKKYKRCCAESDQAAWRVVSLKTRQADAACALLRTLPPTGRSFDPRP